MSLSAGKSMHRYPGTPALCLTEPQSPLFFTASSCGDFSTGTETLGWGTWDTARTRCSSEGTSVVEIALPIFNYYRGYGDQSILLFYPSYQSQSGLVVRLLSSVQLDFRKFAVMVVL